MDSATRPPVTSTPPSAPPPAPDFSPLQRSVGRFHGWEPLRVEGALPSELRGDLLRAGPGLLERFGRRLSHTFEADGALMGLRLRGDGRAEGSVRVVESPGYRAEEAAGRPLFGSAAPRWRRLLNALRQRDKATGNTSVMTWQGRAFALMEGARPVEIDPESLDTLAPSDLGGVLGPTFSAHPHRLDARGTILNFGQLHGPKPALDLYALPDRGAARRLGRVPLRFNTMVHDFAITERYAAFVISPLRIRIGRALLAPKDMLSLLAWEPELGAELLVVPLDRVDAATRVPLSARFVFHLANAFERGDELVVDFIQYADLGVLGALSGQGAPGEAAISLPHLRRVVVDPRRGDLRDDAPLWETTCEFPVLPAARVGNPYASLWMVTGDGVANGLARLDVETLEADVWRPEPRYSPSEALFIPRPGAARDDEGWLVSLIYDAAAKVSFWGVFDAQDLAAGPIAKAWLDQPLPSSFHGAWIPRS